MPSFLDPFFQLLECHNIKLQNFFGSRMNSITSNEFTLDDNFCSAKEIVKQDSSLAVGSLGVVLLFTNIPLDEAIKIH